MSDFYEDHNDDPNDDIRPPDEIIKDKLIERYESDDDEMNLALELSHNEYLTENNLYNDDLLNEDIQKALDSSIDDYTNKLEEIALQESIKIENERIKNAEILNRKKSLEDFSKRIKSLSFSSNEIEIKNYIENILNEYFNLNIDYVYLEDDIYEKIYRIIDSYYLIPMQKKYKKTAISFEEDQIIRNIFLKK
jgi:hypothetical protein